MSYTADDLRQRRFQVSLRNLGQMPAVIETKEATHQAQIR